MQKNGEAWYPYPYPGERQGALDTDGVRTAEEEAFIEALRLMARKAEENHQELILEPLGPKYSNYINTVVQAVQLISHISALYSS